MAPPECIFRLNNNSLRVTILRRLQVGHHGQLLYYSNGLLGQAVASCLSLQKRRPSSCANNSQRSCSYTPWLVWHSAWQGYKHKTVAQPASSQYLTLVLLLELLMI
jgi:hypothetical protein